MATCTSTLARLAAASILAACARPQSHDTAAASAPRHEENVQARASSPASSAWRVFIDPDTGEPIAAPAAPAAQSAAAPARAPGPVLQELQSPGGGTLIRLEHRFDQHAVATLRDDGAVQSSCGEHAP